MNLNKDIQCLNLVNLNKLKKLNRLGIYTLRDLLYYFPRQYEDKSKFKNIKDLINDEKVSVRGTIVDKNIYIKDKIKIIKIKIIQQNDFLVLTFFNQEYYTKLFNVGDNIIAFGKIKRQFNLIEMVNCEIEKENEEVEIGHITPVYNLKRGINNREIFYIIRKVLNQKSFSIDEYMPKDLLIKYRLCDINFAIKNVHIPKNKDSLKVAMYRLIFEEFLILQLGLLYFKNEEIRKESIVINKSNTLESIINDLPFSLTHAQRKVLDDIILDMSKNIPMNRLVQGDVGCGKTIVAALALVNTALNGYQGCMMAPTEILAYQHYIALKELFSDLNIEILVGSKKKKDRENILKDLYDGNIDILIGTHALIEENVVFKNLALIITDEQHRFGVKQRNKLLKKGKNPHTLVMTATPIPRTLALILYSDLDVSIIDELPPNRKKVDTIAVDVQKRKKAYDFAKNQIRDGRQIYVVCPLVEESEVINAKSTMILVKELEEKYLIGQKIGLLHGKMKPFEKDEIMNDFKDKNIDVLTATTIIEVGVNVPNATVMIIENAERFGLAQLHQLRGRVGRGEHKSYCILIYSSNNQIARERINIMTKSNDGFEISQKDLEIRGPGEFFGTKQHGVPELKIANIFKHMKILRDAQILSKEIINIDKNLQMHIDLRREIENKFEKNFEDISLN